VNPADAPTQDLRRRCEAFDLTYSETPKTLLTRAGGPLGGRGPHCELGLAFELTESLGQGDDSSSPEGVTYRSGRDSAGAVGRHLTRRPAPRRAMTTAQLVNRECRET
jgi:hypothetical protein